MTRRRPSRGASSLRQRARYRRGAGIVPYAGEREAPVTRAVELLWFSDCPHHAAARRLLREVLATMAPGTPIRDLDASGPMSPPACAFLARRPFASTGATLIRVTWIAATTARVAGCIEPTTGCAGCRSAAGSRTRCARPAGRDAVCVTTSTTAPQAFRGGVSPDQFRPSAASSPRLRRRCRASAPARCYRPVASGPQAT